MVEQIMKRGGSKVGMLLVDFSEDDGSHANFALEGSLLSVLVIRNLGAHA